MPIKPVNYYELDVTDSTANDRVFDQIASSTRYSLRGVIACAGIFDRAPAIEYSADRIRQFMNIKLTGSFLVAQAAARIMRNQNVSGSIVMIASMSGAGVNKGLRSSAYNSSKAALHQLTRSFAAEWSKPGGNSEGDDAGYDAASPQIRVNSISPGYIRTDQTAPMLRENPNLERLWEEGNMIGRLSYAHEYRAPALFLLGDGSSFVTGSDLDVSGGHLAW